MEFKKKIKWKFMRGEEYKYRVCVCIYETLPRKYHLCLKAATQLKYSRTSSLTSIETYSISPFFISLEEILREIGRYGR
jgi:hypothetical protein